MHHGQAQKDYSENQILTVLISNFLYDILHIAYLDCYGSSVISTARFEPDGMAWQGYVAELTSAARHHVRSRNIYISIA